MPILDNLDLKLDADAVIRGQGADPNIIRTRRPQLIEVAERALQDCLPLLQPRVLYERYVINESRHNFLTLEGGGRLHGDALVQVLGPAQELMVMLCTIGSAVEQLASKVMEGSDNHPGDMVHGLAIYGVGSAAVEALANAACQYGEAQAAAIGWQTTIPLSPGMVGWSVAEGQPQIFSLLDGNAINVRLTDRSIMLPLKSLSMLIGIGSNLEHSGTPCDYCALHNTCQYRV